MDRIETGVGRPPVSHTVRVAVAALAVLGFLALVAILYAAGLHAFPGDSDGATAVLEGQSMSGGNFGLDGWWLSMDSFWTVDALFYTAAVPVLGVSRVLLYLVPAVIAALVIVLGAGLARGSSRGRAGVLAMGTTIALLALPNPVLAMFILRGPLHVGTMLWCLLAFAILQRARPRWGCVLAAVIFAAGILGDLQTVPLGIAPAVGAGVIAMLRRRSWRAGGPAIASAVGGLVLAYAVRKVAVAIGTFSIGRANERASGHQILQNIAHLPSWSAQIFGVGNGENGRAGVPVVLASLRIIGLLVVLVAIGWALTRTIRGMVRGLDDDGSRLDDLLLLACLGDLCFYLALTTTSTDPAYIRYLSPVVVFGAILAGRLVGRSLPRWSAHARTIRIAGVVAALVLASWVAGFAITASGATPPATSKDLIASLQSRGLTQGLGDYWSASITTVTSKDQIRVRPVIASQQDGQLIIYRRQASADWYRGQSFNFLVFDEAVPWGNVTTATATQTFGSPAESYRVGIYRVMVFSSPITVS
ncbi:MAG: putative rane protein [Frankiales bacterium]|nr:putative rane protein [Frankiales bacterium]